MLGIEALRKSEEEFRSLAESMPQIVWATRPDGGNIYFNQQWVDYTGLTLEESHGSGWIKPFHPDDQPRAWEAWQNALQRNDTYSIECRLRRADGVYRWWLVRGAPLRDAGGIILKWFGTCTDIEGIKQAEAERETLHARLSQAQKMESVGRLAGGVAHDFNNKLQVILGSAQMLLQMVPADDAARPLIEEIHTAGRRSADLTRQLLSFSREQAVAPVALDLNQAITGGLKMLGRLIGENVRMDFIATTGLWPVFMDPGQLDQILANLTVNARDAIPGVGTVTIGVSNRTLTESDCRDRSDFVGPGDHVVMTFRDDGVGMSPEVRSHIFEPFYTTKALGRGTGLGLATVYGIIKQNRGAIEVESEPGCGTTFTLYLPRSANEAGAVVEEQVAQAPRGAETILLVEDEESVLNLLRITLGQQGYKVLPASLPDLALEVCERHQGPIHLLLTDVMMPGMSGKVLAERIRTLRPDIRVIFMSGYTAEIMKQNGQPLRNLHLLQKPFTNSELARHVREALDRAVGPAGEAAMSRTGTQEP
jgi:PAS domain S-box-containing protein